MYIKNPVRIMSTPAKYYYICSLPPPLHQHFQSSLCLYTNSNTLTIKQSTLGLWQVPPIPKKYYL